MSKNMETKSNASALNYRLPSLNQMNESRDNTADLLCLDPRTAEKMLLIFAKYIGERDRQQQDDIPEEEIPESFTSHLNSDDSRRSSSISDEDKLAIIAQSEKLVFEYTKKSFESQHSKERNKPLSYLFTKANPCTNENKTRLHYLNCNSEVNKTPSGLLRRKIETKPKLTALTRGKECCQIKLNDKHRVNEVLSLVEGVSGSEMSSSGQMFRKKRNKSETSSDQSEQSFGDHSLKSFQMNNKDRSNIKTSKQRNIKNSSTVLDKNLPSRNVSLNTLMRPRIRKRTNSKSSFIPVLKQVYNCSDKLTDEKENGHNKLNLGSTKTRVFKLQKGDIPTQICQRKTNYKPITKYKREYNSPSSTNLSSTSSDIIYRNQLTGGEVKNIERLKSRIKTGYSSDESSTSRKNEIEYILDYISGGLESRNKGNHSEPNYNKEKRNRRIRFRSTRLSTKPINDDLYFPFGTYSPKDPLHNKYCPNDNIRCDLDNNMHLREEPKDGYRRPWWYNPDLAVSKSDLPTKSYETSKMYSAYSKSDDYEGSENEYLSVVPSLESLHVPDLLNPEIFFEMLDEKEILSRYRKPASPLIWSKALADISYLGSNVKGIMKSVSVVFIFLFMMFIFRLLIAI